MWHGVRKGTGEGGWAACFCLIAFLTASCRTPTFQQVDLSAPGWQNRTGQAIWKPDGSKPEIVGDILVASDAEGNAYLQFSKALPIVSARLTRRSWQIEFPPQNKRYAAPGNPPARIGWLQLLRALNGHEIPSPWEITERTPGSLTLLNGRTGERIEAHF